ncbi:phosphopantothenoylcysteine decarboxylase [Marinicella meishanensis]|uniref:phosphopantothenoylcysteine decarboxylase n=1 Tax=Marinicella meishanensis TaxID=2873263 RepID=UPI001CBE5BFE|nr:phosphopantothenoylcysteine decarboxylase [Marinicella sp. NBU2979]
MNILVTAGGTKEYIDGVRYIGNCSSGRTGAELVDYLSQLGHQVTWIGARNAIQPMRECKRVPYETFDDLSAAMQQALANEHYDAVFQAAAVSDFKVDAVILDGQQLAAGRDVKLPTADTMQLQLKKQPKLVSQIKHWSKNPNTLVVAFKLTNSLDPAVRQKAIDKLLGQAVIDLVAHNDLNEFNDCEHGFCLHQKSSEHTSCVDIRALADVVLQQLEAVA